jgi:hypothetical protein
LNYEFFWMQGIVMLIFHWLLFILRAMMVDPHLVSTHNTVQKFISISKCCRSSWQMHNLSVFILAISTWGTHLAQTFRKCSGNIWLQQKRFIFQNYSTGGITFQPTLINGHNMTSFIKQNFLLLLRVNKIPIIEFFLSWYSLYCSSYQVHWKYWQHIKILTVDVDMKRGKHELNISMVVERSQSNKMKTVP